LSSAMMRYVYELGQLRIYSYVKIESRDIKKRGIERAEEQQ
jgi:hypothetical protein